MKKNIIFNRQLLIGLMFIGLGCLAIGFVIFFGVLEIDDLDTDQIGTIVTIPRPDDCKKIISKKCQNGKVYITYQTKNGDVAVSNWKIVYEGTARLSDSQIQKEEKSPVP